VRLPFPSSLCALPLALALLLSGCSGGQTGDRGAVPANAGGTYNGGQTGSLIPSCGIAPSSPDGTSVPTGEQAAVLDTRGCETMPNLAELTLTDAAGDAVPVQLEELDDGVYLVKGSAVLTEGEYDVTLPAGVEMPTAAVEVVEAAPLPMSVGELRRYDEYCGLGQFALEPSAELVPYLPLTRFTYLLDARGVQQPAVDYGTLEAKEGPVQIPVTSGCVDPPCDLSGRHQVTVYASIAGETMQPDPATVEFDMRCGDDIADNKSGCTLASTPLSNAADGWLITAIAVLGLLMVARRSLGGAKA